MKQEKKQEKDVLTSIKGVEPFARGKRGLVSLGYLGDEQVLLKKHNPEASVDTIAHEADMLVLLNRFGLGPTFLFFDDDTLVREFVCGEEFLEHIEVSDKEEVLRVLSEVFYQCRIFDLLGVNKLELTRPYKHVIIASKDSRFRRRGSVVQIDFERAKKTNKPKNVTQFVQCLCRRKVVDLLGKKGVVVNKDELFLLGKEYKESLREDVFEKIIASFGGVVVYKGFSERVYRLVTNIPCGRVTTYKEVARKLGVKSSQAIGQALKKNPFAPLVPCHRVVKIDGSLGGFFGSREDKAVFRKQELLAQEGIILKQGFVDKEKIIEL